MIRENPWNIERSTMTIIPLAIQSNAHCCLGFRRCTACVNASAKSVNDTVYDTRVVVCAISYATHTLTTCKRNRSFSFILSITLGRPRKGSQNGQITIYGQIAIYGQITIYRQIMIYRQIAIYRQITSIDRSRYIDKLRSMEDRDLWTDCDLLWTDGRSRYRSYRCAVMLCRAGSVWYRFKPRKLFLWIIQITRLSTGNMMRM